MYIYQKTHRYFGQIAEGLEEEGAAELTDIGAGNIQPAYRGLHFEADRETLYRVNYTSRLLTRVLAPLASFPCRSPDELYAQAKSIAWTDFLSLDNTLAVFASVWKSDITHSQYAALRLKDAIVDAFREKLGKRPNVDPLQPDFWFNLYIEGNRAVVSLDTSGGSLHRRGYRKESVEAPMQETVAAAVIRLSGWDGTRPLHDPMCGSGTLLIEAMMKHCRIPAGFLRKRFGFERLPDFDRGLWESVRKKEDREMRNLPHGLISGSDLSQKAVSAARANLSCLPFGERVRLRMADFLKIESLENQAIVTNPPYGVRLEKERNLAGFYKEMGDFLKQRCKGSAAYIYFGNREMIKAVGLKPAWKKPLRFGALDGRLVKYEMY